ncbi:hypothetical protein ABVT39_026345 [Epinephelus coioides]
MEMWKFRRKKKKKKKKKKRKKKKKKKKALRDPPDCYCVLFIQNQIQMRYSRPCWG